MSGSDPFPAPPSSPGVTTRAGAQSSRIIARRRSGSPTASGTNTAPSAAPANAATTKSTELVMCSATLSCSPTPRIAMPSATAAISSRSCA